MSARQKMRRKWARQKAASAGRVWQTGAESAAVKAVERATERKSHGAKLTTEERWTLALARNPLDRARQIVQSLEIQEEHGRQHESHAARQSSLGTRVKHIARPAMQVGQYGKNDSPIPFEGN